MNKHGADIVLIWLCTYLLHSSLLLLGAQILDYFKVLRKFGLTETVWRFALFAGLLTTSLQLLMQSMPESTMASFKFENRYPVPSIAASTTTTRPNSTLPPPIARQHIDSNRNTEADTPTKPEIIKETSERNKLNLPEKLFAYSRPIVLLFFLWIGWLLIRLAISITRLNRLTSSMELLHRAQLPHFLEQFEKTHGLCLRFRLNHIWHSPFVAPDGSICIPHWCLNQLSERQRVAMLGHELAHLVRKDIYWRIAIELVTDIFFFQALNRVAKAKLMLQAELACDQQAALLSGHPNNMAQALFACAESSFQHALPKHAIAMAQASSLLIRMNQLLNENIMPNANAPTSRLTLLFKFSALILIAAGLILGLPKMGLSNPIIQKTSQTTMPVSATRPKPNSTPLATTNSKLDLATASLDKRVDKEISLSVTTPPATQSAAPELQSQAKTPPAIEVSDQENPKPVPSQTALFEDAQLAFKQGKYEAAYTLYTQLAEQGHNAAQTQVGEMLWYGEGAPVQAAQAKIWFAKAAAAGNARAQAFLDLFAERDRRKDEIAYFTKAYDAAEIQWDEDRCGRSIFINFSSNSADRDVLRRYDSWQHCYNKYTKKLVEASQKQFAANDDLKRIMTSEEIKLATQLAQNLYEKNAQLSIAAKKEIEQKVDQWEKNLHAYEVTSTLWTANRYDDQRYIESRNYPTGPGNPHVAPEIVPKPNVEQKQK